jgi:hypothetical protein
VKQLRIQPQGLKRDNAVIEKAIDGTRRFLCKLKAGEAGWVLKLDRIEY